MKTTTISTVLALFAIVAGLGALSPSAYADHGTAEVTIPEGTSVPGCEETNECYIPYEVTIDVGGEVTWTNDDTAAHTVTSGTPEDGPDGNFDSGLFMAGATFSEKFDDYEPGEYPYFCMVHPWMQGVVIVQGATEGEHDKELMVDIMTGSAGKGERMSIDVTFTDMEGNQPEHVNYDIKATQGDKVVLDEKSVHAMEGQKTHMTAPLPNAASDSMPVNVEVTFQGYGIDEPFTGPIGHVATKKVVPEFGTIAMMILGISIVSIIALGAKSKIAIPRI